MLLADTIRRWLALQKPSPAQRVELVRLLHTADQGSKTILTDASLLSNVQSGLCQICSGGDKRPCAGEDRASYCRLVQVEDGPLVP